MNSTLSFFFIFQGNKGTDDFATFKIMFPNKFFQITLLQNVIYSKNWNLFSNHSLQQTGINF